jgi:hypothetical protein
MSEIPGVDPTEPDPNPCACEGCVVTASMNGGAAAPVSQSPSGGADIAFGSFRSASNPQEVICNANLTFSFGQGSCDEADGCAPAAPCNINDVKLTVHHNGPIGGHQVLVSLMAFRGPHGAEPVSAAAGMTGGIVTWPVKLLPGSTGGVFSPGGSMTPSSHDLPCGSDAYTFRLSIKAWDVGLGGWNIQEQSVTVACSACKVKPS